jgi:hypothetical protein
MRDTLAWSSSVGGDGTPTLSEVLARRFERDGPRIDGCASTISGVWTSSESVDELMNR